MESKVQRSWTSECKAKEREGRERKERKASVDSSDSAVDSVFWTNLLSIKINIRPVLGKRRAREKRGLK